MVETPRLGHGRKIGHLQSPTQSSWHWRSQMTEKVLRASWNWKTLTKHWGTVCYLHLLSSDSFTTCCQSLSFHTKPSRPQLSSQAAESASHRIALHFLTLLGEEGEAHRMKVTRMKCSLGQMPNSCRWDKGCNPFDYSGLWWKVNKQIRATTHKHSLVFTVKTLDTSGIFL